ncbi:DUF6188 family protein [Gandjariella thermophila]|uniref:Uncharacterized protein n=1 Tax=Gandjariella thermophila TaxID=1931992 RepID=A0A4D4JG82_9PSEU|nr:DUF6188 family protein [Gandjariella thermophila]GDY34030.1 hypothetical protein GTS_56630 [Gandjariella thermophila]
MKLDLRGQTVTAQEFGYTLSLATSGGYEVHIEKDYSICSPQGVRSFSPDPSNVDSEQVRALAERDIVSLVAEESGVLTVAFPDGISLRGEPSDAYEAWNVTGPGGMRVVCMPGGELAKWGAEQE